MKDYLCNFLRGKKNPSGLKIQSKQTIFEQKLQKQLNLYFGIHTITTEYILLEIVIDTSPSFSNFWSILKHSLFRNICIHLNISEYI